MTRDFGISHNVSSKAYL